eukprot:CAMPEP_0168835230 /NCGR_PEP_ID=MMETSP0727-20121128/3986_1 /TAXON_ID=265536 /ORGANISM="Amphiprora sp., Strain CCMP467" /LENGTH=39 /DNA_ID= /DNA_START= /DNA_END= /DNA_ORIENTATION=
MTDKKDPPIPMERGFTDDDLVRVVFNREFFYCSSPHLFT